MKLFYKFISKAMQDVVSGPSDIIVDDKVIDLADYYKVDQVGADYLLLIGRANDELLHVPGGAGETLGKLRNSMTQGHTAILIRVTQKFDGTHMINVDPSTESFLIIIVGFQSRTQQQTPDVLIPLRPLLILPSEIVVERVDQLLQTTLKVREKDSHLYVRTSGPSNGLCRLAYR